MKKFIGMLLGVLVTLTGHAAAQGPGEMIAYDSCQWDYWWSAGDGDGTLKCDVYLMAEGIPTINPEDGSANALIGDGADPVWSRDGSRLAFAGSREPGIFVLNLGDWSLAKVFSGGDSPAWSPDGMKLAFAAGELYVMGADGSGVTQLTNNVGFIGQPAWSPDGGTIAFDCEVESGNRDICSINADGTGFLRLTSDPAWDWGPAFSPDGSAIAFAQYWTIVIMNPDGSGITQVGAGTDGSQPAWSPDGTSLVYVESYQGACQADGVICQDYIVITNVAGTERLYIAGGNRPAWALSVRPVAWFLSQGCNGLACGFDGSGSWGGSGGIVSYTWNFGDGTSDTGPTPAHVYAATGTYRITLTVTDDLGVASTQSRDLEIINDVWPTASFTSL